MAPPLCAGSSKLAALLLLIPFLAYSAVHKVEGLSCWECNSRHDPNCGEPFKNHTISYTDCSQRFLAQDPGLESTICRKTVQKVQGETRIIRGCGFLTAGGATCFMRAGTHQVFVYYCQCGSGDGCNGAQNPKPSWESLIGSAAVLLLSPCVRPWPSSPTSGLS